jgi:hypothetical protein
MFRRAGINKQGADMKSVFLASLFSIALAAPIPALGWGENGHETVGYIAASLIAGTNADKEVKKLLQPGENMATAAEWMDCAKGKQYCHKDPTQEMKDFAEANPNHHSYHYTDIPFQFDAYAEDEVGATPDDIVHILGGAILVLKDQPPTNSAHQLTKREALFILAHMVGDIHQPLHVGAAYVDSGDQFVVPETAAEAKDEFTEGGNFLCKGSKPVHSYWDDTLVVSAMKKAKVTISKAFAAKRVPTAKNIPADALPIGTWPTIWASESVAVAEQELALLTVLDRRKAGPAKSPCSKTHPSNDRFVWDVEFP